MCSSGERKQARISVRKAPRKLTDFSPMAGSPHVLLPWRGQWGSRGGPGPQAARGGSLSWEGQVAEVNLSEDSASCDPGQVTSAMETLTQKVGQSTCVACDKEIK